MEERSRRLEQMEEEAAKKGMGQPELRVRNHFKFKQKIKSTFKL